MALIEPRDDELNGYLMGAMDEDARRSFEERLVSDPDLFETLAAYEDELDPRLCPGRTRRGKAAAI